MNPTAARWPVFIIVLVLTFALFSWWSLERALSSGGPAIAPGYHSHGQHYSQAENAESLDWRISPQVRGRQLTVRVEDGHQAPVPGCQAFLTLAGGPQQPPLQLIDAGDGRYLLELPANLPTATLSASLTLQRAGVNLERRLIISLGP